MCVPACLAWKGKGGGANSTFPLTNHTLPAHPPGRLGQVVEANNAAAAISQPLLNTNNSPPARLPAHPSQVVEANNAAAAAILSLFTSLCSEVLPRLAFKFELPGGDAHEGVALQFAQRGRWGIRQWAGANVGPGVVVAAQVAHAKRCWPGP